jgi:hypothetical protein
MERAQWSFHQKLSLYIALVDPPTDQIERLRGFNKLRNTIAHDPHVDPETAVFKHLGWKEGVGGDDETPQPEALAFVRAVGGMILFGDFQDVYVDWVRTLVEFNNGNPPPDHPDEKTNPDCSN